MFINVSIWCCFMFLNFILVLHFFYILQIFSSFSIQKYVHLVAIIFVNSKALDAMIQLFGVMNYSFFFFCWLDRFYGTFVTQRELAGPVTCLAHWILFNGSVLCSVSCSVPLPTYLHTLLYTALFVRTLRVQKVPILPPRKITLQSWICSIAFDPSWTLLWLREGTQERLTRIERLKLSSRNSEYRKNCKKKKQKKKNEKTRTFCPKEDICQIKTKNI